MIAADAAGHPDPQTLKDAGFEFIAQYVGTAYQAYGVSRAYIDACHAIGLPVMLIFEEWGSQFLGGYDAAVASCGRMLAGWNALGVPDGPFPAVALIDPNPGVVYGNEQALLDYARGWNDTLPFAEWTGYGSAYGLELAATVAPKMTRRWGVGTWGYGEAGNGWLPDPLPSPANMIQHGNAASPVGGTDLNTLFTLDMGQWPRPGTPPVEENEIMYIAVGNAVMGRIACTVDGGYRVGPIFSGPIGAFNIPQSALDWNAVSGRGLKYVDLDEVRFAVVLQERPSEGPGVPCPDCPPGLGDASNDQILAELDYRLP